MRRFFIEWFTGGCLGHPDRHHGDRPDRHDNPTCCGLDGHRLDRRGDGHPSRHGHDDHDGPIHDSDRPGSLLVVPAGNSVVPVDNNAVPVDKPAAGGNNAAMAGNTVQAVSNTCAGPSSNDRQSNKTRHRSNTALGTCRPRNGSSWILHRNRARTHQETIPIKQSAEFGGAFFDRAWRPPGPRVSHTSDAGRRQSMVRRLSKYQTLNSESGALPQHVETSSR